MKEQITVIENKKLNLNIFLIIAASVTLVCVAFAAICFAVSSINSLDKNNNPTAITVVGEGEINVLPDSATITATIRDSGPTVVYAQGAIDVKAKNLTAALDKMGIDSKDIRSLSYSTRPKYELKATQCETAPCQNKYELSGYEAVQTVQIKAHKVELAGEIVTQLGILGINEISGPNFTVDDNEKPKSEARIAAIKNSQSKAEAIAKALSVKLGKVIKFEEDNNISKYPIYFAKSATSKAANLSPGEDIIKAKVIVTYSLE
jgi:uncharacterized protein YggE